MRILLIVFAIFLLASGSALFLFQDQLFPSPPAPVAVAEPEPEPVRVSVYAPARTIAIGTIVAKPLLRQIEISPEALTKEMIRPGDTAAADEEVFGSVAKVQLQAGVPLSRQDVVFPGERGFLAAVLPQGKRAITIEVNVTSGLNGLVVAGDRVDLILTYQVDKEEGGLERDLTATETIVGNIRVLALDERMQNVPDISKEGTPLPAPVAQTATIEVTPRQAELISLASSIGQLSMALNSVYDGGAATSDVAAGVDADAVAGMRTDDVTLRPSHIPDIPEHDGPTLDSDLNEFLRDLRNENPATQPASPRVKIVRRSETETIDLDDPDGEPNILDVIEAIGKASRASQSSIPE